MLSRPSGFCPRREPASVQSNQMLKMIAEVIMNHLNHKQPHKPRVCKLFMKVADGLLRQCHLITTILLINYTCQNHMEEAFLKNQHCFIIYTQIFKNFLLLNFPLYWWWYLYLLHNTFLNC